MWCHTMVKLQIIPLIINTVPRMGLESRTRGSKGPTSVTGSDKRWIEIIHDNRISRWRKWTDKLTVRQYGTNIFLCHLQMSTHGKHLTNFKCCKVLTRCHYNTCVNCKASVFFPKRSMYRINSIFLSNFRTSQQINFTWDFEFLNLSVLEMLHR